MHNTPNKLHIVLVHPEIPHNTGAIGRLCVGLDWSLHLIKPLGFQLSDKYLKRSGMDYWQDLDVHTHDSWEKFIEAINPPNLYFLSTKGEKSLYDCEFKPNDALVFGSEGHGLPKDFYEKYKSQLFKIPMPNPNARSINLANAVSIAAYEGYRQIRG